LWPEATSPQQFKNVNHRSRRLKVMLPSAAGERGHRAIPDEVARADSNVVAAVDAGAAWLAKVKLPPDHRFKKSRQRNEARRFQKGDGSVWARYYEIRH